MPAARPVASRLLVAATAAQAALAGYRAFAFLQDLQRFPSRLARIGQPGAFSSALFLLGLLAVAALWAHASCLGGGSFPERLGASVLAHLAALGLLHMLAGLLLGHLVRALSPALLFASAAAATFVIVRRRGAESRPAPSTALEPWDAATALLLLALLIPTFFPYVHFDAKAIWACRAFAMERSGSLAAVTACSQPGYPPLFSLLLWTGLGDPVLEGRLVPWALLAALALFLRARFARVLPRGAAPATLFVVGTGHVWVTSGMYYANSALMAFLAAGVLLSLGLPAPEGADPRPSSAERVAGLLCLAAAAAVRPDGLVYAGVVFIAVLVSRRVSGSRLALWPFVAPLAAWLLWAVRPEAFHAPGDFLLLAKEEWRTVAPDAAEALGRTLLVFLDGWQGQWLSHYGLGLAIYVLLGVAAWQVARLRASREGGVPFVSGRDSAFYALATAGGLSAVLVIYAMIPFTSDPIGAIQPFESHEFIPCYRNFLHVGLGRMTTHLLPFYALFVLAAVRDAAADKALRDPGVASAHPAPQPLVQEAEPLP